MTTSQGAIKFDRRTTGDEVLLKLYKGILKPRLIEEKMLLLIRQGKISKWFSGYGQEAVAVGSAAAIHDDEYILPLHRNLGIFTWRNIPLSRLFAQFMGKMSGFSDGRERSFHFGTREFHIVGMISHLAAMLGVADGIALAHKLRGEGRVVLAFSGDGSTSEGDFHEAVNLAAVWDLPVLFIIENNGFGLSTPANEQYRCKALVERAVGYGINGVQVDGNNILDLFHTVSDIAGRMRNKPEPFLLECITFRMRGHEEASGTKYIPREIFDEWKQKDPVINFENYLLSEGLLSPDLILRIKEEMNSKIQNAWDEAFAEPPPVPDTGKELRDIYFPSVNQPPSPPTGKTTKMRFVDAISDALRVSLKRHPDLILMGQDIAGYGGVFKVTEGFYREFGKEKIRNTPLCESAVLGAALGLSISGYKSVVEMQFADFITCGFNQVVNNIAKNYWRWGQNADVVIRMPTGAGVGAGPFHSQSNEAWFFHTPGLKIVYPSSPADAKGLLISAIEDQNPVMFFEHKAMYRSISGEVPDGFYTTEIGKANVLRTGSDLTIITYGYGVHWATKTLDMNPEISADLIDLRSLKPLDTVTIFESVKKTGKAIILHEDTITGGIGGELSAVITRECFEYLDAPVFRCGSLDTPIPFAGELEKNFLPEERFIKTLLDLDSY